MVASPRRLDPQVYDAIYAVPGGPPGYDRNFQYARAVARVRDPLTYLASRQDAFWGVLRVLQRFSNPRILEVGCGLGYFTYALKRAGFAATGIDLSGEAVERARATFGDLYQRESIESYAARARDRFDAVVLVEVVEHLEDPIIVLRNALRLLAPGGSIIISTPNRTFFGDDSRWRTDLPPVHLWWLAEDSIRAIARRLGCEASLVDFSEYSARFPVLYVYDPPLEPMFSADGRLVRREAAFISIARKWGILQEGYWAASRFMAPFRRKSSSRRPTMVAALSQSGAVGA